MVTLSGFVIKVILVSYNFTFLEEFVKVDN